MSDPIDTLERFEFGGATQWALVRGQSVTSPVLLLIQAGPGFPMIHEASAIERQLHLESMFRVVYWDQRGTGKSFDAGATETMTLELLVEDVRQMVRALCERLHVSEVDIVGFSIGASLALLACHDHKLPVRSLICVGPDVNTLEAERHAYAFALAEAERRGHKKALRALHKIGSPPHADSKRFMVRLRWVSNFGGIHTRKTFFSMVRENIGQLWSSPHYSLREMIRAIRGMTTTQERMLPALLGFDLLAHPLRVGVPTAVFQGQLYAGGPNLSAMLADAIGAELVWFENSAHMPHQEEPDRFRAALRRFIARSGAAAGSRSRGVAPAAKAAPTALLDTRAQT